MAAQTAPLGALERVQGLFCDYAHCIDDDRLEQWPDLFVEDCVYRVIPRENLGGRPPLAIIHLENRGQLRDRVLILRQALVFAERYNRRIIGNLRVDEAGAWGCRAVAAFVVYATDKVEGTTALFGTGKYEAEIAFEAAGTARFRRLDAVIDTCSIPRQMPYPI